MSSLHLSFTFTRLAFLIVAVAWSFEGKAQNPDTVYVTERVEFSSKRHKDFFGKGYHGKYGREDIIFNERHKKIAYCYYEDGKRSCRSREYKILNDSTLWVDNFDSWKNDNGAITWRYKKIAEDSFYIYRFDSTFYESGYASSLIPLIIPGELTTTLANKKDTLWRLAYPLKWYAYYWRHFVVSFHKTHINGKLYEYNEIDNVPTHKDGHSLGKIEIEGIIGCPCEPFCEEKGHTISCTITSEGHIRNIEIAFGCLNEYCPYTFMEIICELQNWGQLKPATQNGQNVNVRWFITVEDQLEVRAFQHPAYEDNDENRAAFIKRKLSE